MHEPAGVGLRPLGGVRNAWLFGLSQVHVGAEVDLEPQLARLRGHRVTKNDIHDGSLTLTDDGVVHTRRILPGAASPITARPQGTVGGAASQNPIGDLLFKHSGSHGPLLEGFTFLFKRFAPLICSANEGGECIEVCFDGVPLW